MVIVLSSSREEQRLPFQRFNNVSPARDFNTLTPPALSILFEDQDLIVLNKDAGIAVHPGAGRNSGTLVDALRLHSANLSSLGGEAPARALFIGSINKRAVAWSLRKMIERISIFRNSSPPGPWRKFILRS